MGCTKATKAAEQPRRIREYFMIHRVSLGQPILQDQSKGCLSVCGNYGGEAMLKVVNIAEMR
jgi:hypothetical protein